MHPLVQLQRDAIHHAKSVSAASTQSEFSYRSPPQEIPSLPVPNEMHFRSYPSSKPAHAPKPSTSRSNLVQTSPSSSTSPRAQSHPYRNAQHQRSNSRQMSPVASSPSQSIPQTLSPTPTIRIEEAFFGQRQDSPQPLGAWMPDSSICTHGVDTCLERCVFGCQGLLSDFLAKSPTMFPPSPASSYGSSNEYLAVSGTAGTSAQPLSRSASVSSFESSSPGFYEYLSLPMSPSGSGGSSTSSNPSASRRKSRASSQSLSEALSQSPAHAQLQAQLQPQLQADPILNMIADGSYLLTDVVLPEFSPNEVTQFLNFGAFPEFAAAQGYTASSPMRHQNLQSQRHR